MQIFVLDVNPYDAARFHCDKHVVKMIVEYAQLLSTAHRILDGAQQWFEKPNGKMQRLWLLDGETVSYNQEVDKFKIDTPRCYNATHLNHPCALWARATDANYFWLFSLLHGCLREYTHRYGKLHAVESMMPFFSVSPKNICRSQLTPFAMAVPEEYRVPNDPIASYKAFYVGAKAHFTRWTNRPLPSWFEQAIKGKYDITTFVRARNLGT